MYDKFFIDPEVQWSDFATKIHMERRTEHVLNHVDDYISRKLKPNIVLIRVPKNDAPHDRSCHP